ncbi:heparanase-like protein 3 isoform X2 [Phoenix dactylifera]|uniref:Heparanase-like protein 3 isoform X2 n=1 Tax=Phoenix dactylifera TaxID=42345 RepID=A0A8B8ZCT7_PHODC|nr:heparanase-like protein 3 isoform X2 [Phoenix dactylifera]
MGQLPLRSLTMTSFALRWIGGRRRSVITGLVAGASHPCSIWCFIFSFLQNLSNKILLNAVKEFSPLKLRIGGSLQDKVIYGVDPQQPCTPFVKKKSEMFGFSQGCLPMHRWDELNGFFKKAGAVIIFGLNALNGRVHLPGGSLGGPWNSTNAASFIHYTVNKGYTIHGWELGKSHVPFRFLTS